MGKQTPGFAEWLRSVDPTAYWKAKCIAMTDLFILAARHLPEIRKSVALEQWRDIDNRIREAHNGTQDNPDGTT